MNCPYCGFENPDRSSFCNSCGKELPRTSAPGVPPALRHCVSCGRSIPDYANVCPYCGHDYRYQAGMPSRPEAMSSGIKALFYLLSLLIPLAGFIIGAIYYSKDDPDSKHVGKICLVLAVVGILLYVGLSALLYVLTLGYSSDGPGQTPAASLTKTTIANGVKFTVNAVSRTTTWSDVEIFLSDGADFGDWSPSSAYLSGSGVLTETFAAITMGDLAIFCNVTDLAGNGNINAGDYFTFTTGSAQMFSSATTYTVTLMYEPTAEQMCNVYFTG